MRTIRALCWAAFMAVTIAGCSGDPAVRSDAAAAVADATSDGGPCATGQQRCGEACADLRDDHLNCGACARRCATSEVCSNGACQAGCPGGQLLCDGLCASAQTDRLHCGSCGNACAPGRVCSLGRCVVTCDPRLATCGGSLDAGASGADARYCAELSGDNRNCGGCGVACPLGATCVGGSCRILCSRGRTACGNACADLASDRLNCGGCGLRCASGEVCSGGSCQVSCGAGLTNCLGVCRDTASDGNHCGACGRACMAGEVCAGGACRLSCGATLTDCDGVCRETKTDRLHCGSCGRACAAGEVCSASECGATCGAGTVSCDGVCRDLNRDRVNCGACDTKCADGEVCSRGACALACQAGLTECDGVCRDLNTSRGDCGACGRRCAEGQRCSQGTCGTTCAAGLTACGADCVNAQSDDQNCGACGRACPAGTQCAAGVCGTTCAAQLGTCGTGATAYCANTEADPRNCGACGTVCALANVSEHACARGDCAITRCAAGYGDCDRSAVNGCEHDLRADAAHCGGCGRACTYPNASATCAAGACAMGACRRGYADCDRDPANGCEVHLTTALGHCGACGTACAAGSVCSNGVCVTGCTAPLTTCRGTAASPGPATCANTANDPSSCGACGSVCALPSAASQACSAGRCAVVTCAEGRGDCDGDAASGCEADVTASASNCGGCGRACALSNATPVCVGGACAVAACASGFVDCDGAPGDGCEVDTRSDNLHCGACGRACAAGTVCSNGTCGSLCAAPLTRCESTSATGSRRGPFCVNTAVDPEHCGACGTACALPHVEVHACSAGACGVVRCAPGFADCDGAAANGCEVDVSSSAGHCGACGRACAPPNAAGACVAGVCGVMACNPGRADCDGLLANGCEVDTTSDRGACGACGVVCPAGQRCAAGTCAATCGATLTTCGGDPTGVAPSSYCANTANDPANCGSCGRRCELANTATAACAAGMCAAASCTPGFGDCDATPANGCETALLSNAMNCGACGRACSAANGTAACDAGACVVGACGAGFGDCNGRAADGCETNTTNDPANCGGCGQACLAGQVCAGGACANVCPAGEMDCSGACANLSYDPDHCGSCTNACPSVAGASRWCAAGTCGTACAAGRADCDRNATNGCEVDTATVTNCGECGRACVAPANATATCAAGACGFVCVSGFADCDRNPANGCEVTLATTAAHCGGCGALCAGTCAGGVCMPPPPTTTAAPPHTNTLACGYSHSCAIVGGAVYCWGDNSYGQLGNGTRIRSTQPVRAGTLTTAVEVTAGWYSTCARLASGEVYCWGNNVYGQLGINSRVNSQVPVRLNDLTDAVEVRAGPFTTCARRASGAMLCWGLNDGKVGDSNTVNRTVPTAVDGLGVGGASFAVGGFVTCFSRITGSVACTGDNMYGALGNGRTSPSRLTTPATVSGLTNVVELSSGTFSLCARHADGRLSCWGGNVTGEVGSGASGSQYTPVVVADLANVLEVDMGSETTCARRAPGSMGQVQCWGGNGSGQLGDGSVMGRSVPGPVMGLTDAVEIAVGSTHVCARRSNGDIVCWGENGDGQLGDGATADRNRPPTTPVTFPSAPQIN